MCINIYTPKCVLHSLVCRASLVAQRLKRLPPVLETWVRSLGQEDPLEKEMVRKWQPTPVFLPGESHGRRSLVGYSPWGSKESDMTERLHFHFHFLSVSIKLIAVIWASAVCEVFLDQLPHWLQSRIFKVHSSTRFIPEPIIPPD